MALWFTDAVADGGRESLRIKYDGPALEAHVMDVRQLAPSLLALADLFDRAHVLTGDAFTLAPALNVTAQAEGSFAVDLYLALADAGREALDFFNSRAAVGAATAGQLVEYAFLAVRWSLFRRRLGQELLTEEVDPGTIRVHWADGTTLEAPTGCQSLVADMDFNRTAGLVFEPLGQDGVDAVELSREGADVSEAITVHREDLPAFNIIEPPDDLVSDNVRIVSVRLVNLAFKEGNKWKVDDGTSSFWASLHDLEFLQRVNSSEEVFARDDVLRVRLRDQQFRTNDGGFRAEHHIERVLEHRRSLPPPEQIPFEADDGE